MAVAENYDLIVIGDQLSGLFLAAGAAQQGKKVLVLEESNFSSTLFEEPTGQVLGDFIAEPAIGLFEGSPVDEFLKSLGLYQNLEQLFPFHEPPLQLVSRRMGMRLDFPYIKEELAAELKKDLRHSPEMEANLLKLLSGEVVSKKGFSDVVRDLGLPVTFEFLGALQAALYGSLMPANLPFHDYRNLFVHAAHGVRYPLGGRAAIKERLLSRVQAYGGAIRRNSRVEEIVFERGRLEGVLLSSYEGFVRSRLVVGSLAAATFAQLIPKEMRPRRLAEAIHRTHPTAWKLGFTLLVPEEVIPEGMGTHLALVDPELGLEKEGFIQLQVFPKDAYPGVPANQRLILGRLNVPFKEQFLEHKAISTLLKRALAQVETVIPFLRERPFAFYPDPDHLEKDPLYQRYYRFKSLAHIPGSILVFENGFGDIHDLSSLLDWSAFGLEGLALCSRDIRPLYGVLGEVMSAMELLGLWKAKGKL